MVLAWRSSGRRSAICICSYLAVLPFFETAPAGLIAAEPTHRLVQQDSSLFASMLTDGSPGTDACDPCDVNCDTLRNDSDILLFVDILIQGASGCSPCSGDADGNGVIDARDIQLFVDCILQESSPRVTILQNGTVYPNPAYPYRMEEYDEGDLPALRAFASAAGIFADIDMNADWKQREWEMIKAIQAWLVRNARTSAVGLNSKPAAGRAISFLSTLGAGGQIAAWGDDDQYGNVSGVSSLSPNSGFLTIAAGRHHSLALRRNGQIEAWGRNQFSQATPPSPNGDFREIAAGANHNLALTSDGQIVAWGDNSYGQCNVTEPNADFVGISAGIEFSVGLKSDGSVVVWGVLPTDVLLNPEWLGRFIKVAAGGFHCVGLLDDGRIVAWGANANGQCNVPTHLGGISLQNRIVDIGADKRRSYAVVDFGKGVVSWGLPLNVNLLPPGRNRSIWTNPTSKYLLASRDMVPNIQNVIDQPIQTPATSLWTALAYDSDREVVVKFGGRTAAIGGSVLNDTFEWDGREWDGQTPSTEPSPRSDHCMAYDPLRKRIILWGEDSSNGGGTGDAWEWDGKSWAGPYAVNGAIRPSAYRGCRALWDPNRGTVPTGRVAVFFGRSDSEVFDTAYDYDPMTHTFEEREIGGSPGPRYAFGLAYDSLRDMIVLFGGADGSHNASNDTHEAPAGGTGTTTFSLITPATTTPAPRYEHAMVYDEARNKVVMYGGRDGTTYFDETWEWDGTDWELRSPANSPGQRAGHDMVYDAERQVVVLFGGHRNDGVNPGVKNDTWEWDGTNWTQKNLTIIPPGEIPDVSSTHFVFVSYATGSQFGIGLLDYVWSCGVMKQMFAGLCVAHGIPARRLSGRSLSCAGDMLVEAFSTRWNKWILFWQYMGNWVENAEGVPQSHAEMRAHHDAAHYYISRGYELAVGRGGWNATAVDGSGLVFQPYASCTAPLHPRAEGRWWSDKLKVIPDEHDHFDRNLTTSTSRENGPNSQVTTILLNDFTDLDKECGTNFSGRPVSFDGDPNLTYPINNVQAQVELIQESPPQVRIALTHNMVVGTGVFDRYEMSLDGGQTWTTMSLEAAGPGVYVWYPTEIATLMLRGVNQAGVHSPDVVILFEAD